MIRPLTGPERGQLDAALEPFGLGALREWEFDARAQVRLDDERKPPRLYLVSSPLAADLDKRSDGPAPDSGGLFIGELSRAGVEWSLEGAFEVGRRTRRGKVILKDKAAALFQYGRVVLGESILSFDPEARRGRTVFVANVRGEVIGLGKVLHRLPARGPVIEPVVDRGWYLREGG